MKRYHKKIHFPHKDEVKELTEKLNSRPWSYTSHCLENIRYRVADVTQVLLFIKKQVLRPEAVFEYYRDAQGIIKACYRINYSEALDIILVLNNDKKIITIYLNQAEDDHYTLKHELYERGKV